MNVRFSLSENPVGDGDVKYSMSSVPTESEITSNGYTDSFGNIMAK